MNTFIQWQETINDAYLTDTPSYFPLVEPNTSLLPQGSLASIPSNALILHPPQVLRSLVELGRPSERNERAPARKRIANAWLPSYSCSMARTGATVQKQRKQSSK